MSLLRSAAAVLAGIIVLVLLSFLIERTVGTALMQAMTLDKADVPMCIFVVVQTLGCMVVAGYVCAWIAPRAKTKHALVMGVIQLLLTLYAMVALPSYGPLWISVIGVILLVPAAWLGGVLRERSRKKAA